MIESTLKARDITTESARCETICAIVAGLITLVWFGIILKIKLQYYGLVAYRIDLAYYSNMLFNTNLKHFLYTDRDLVRFNQTTFLNEHFAPTLAILAPLYQCFNTPVCLLVVQAAALAGAGYLIYSISRTLMKQNGQNLILSSILPLILQLMFLFQPAVIKATAVSFHHDSLIPLLLFLAVLFAIKGHVALGLVFWGLLLGLKENLPILGMALCLTLWIFKMLPRKTILAALLLCLLFFSGSFFFQHLNGNRHVIIIYRIFSIPAWHDLIADLDKKWEFLLLYAPALLSPLTWAPFTAELVLQLVGKTDPYSWRIYAIIAILSAGFVHGTINCFKDVRRNMPLLFFIFFCIGTSIKFGIGSLEESYRESRYNEPITAAFREDLKILSGNIPQDARLAVTVDLLVFFPNREHLRWPRQLAGAQYILANSASKGQADQDMRLDIKKMTVQGKLCTIANRGTLTLYRATGQ